MGMSADKQFSQAACEQWSKLSAEEIGTVQGDRGRLSGLVRERYGIGEEEAEKQVQDFYHHHSIA